jgi:hypothetical protein
MKHMKQGLTGVVRRLRLHVLLVAGFIIAAGLLLYRLGSLPIGGAVSQPEASLALSNESIRSIILHPLHLPFNLLQWLSVQALPGHHILALRLPSVLIGLLALLALTYVTRRWYGQRIVIFGFIILMTAAPFLHLARLGSYDILYFAAVPLLLTAHIGLHRAPDKKRHFFLWLLVSLGLLYVPGMVWLVALQVVWQRKLLVQAFQALGSWYWRVVVMFVSVLAAVPLVYGLIRDFSVDRLLVWLGLPTVVPDALDLAKNAAAAVLSVFFRMPEDPVRWLGQLPMLGAFLLLCFIAGILFYMTHFRAERTRLLLSVAVVALLLVTAGGPVGRSILIPLVYLVSFGGLAYLLHYWLRMFPINKTARRIGIGLICLAITLTVAYNLRHYFIAWPHNAEVRASFQVPVIPKP